MKIKMTFLSLAAAVSVCAADMPLEIISAKWGAGEKTCDAKAFAAGRLREGKFLVLSCRNAGSLGDPAPMKRKELTVTIRIQGEERTLRVGEYSAPIVVRVGNYPTTEKLTIYSATYGFGEKANNLLETVKRLCETNEKTVVGNQLVGTDPAPGKHKELIVFYSIGNCMRAMIVPEYQTFDPAQLK